MNAEERVDLVDRDGIPRVHGVTRAEVKRRKDELVAAGLFQPIVVVVVITPEHAVLAHERGASKGDDGAGEIDHVCGVIPSGETWDQAARREAAEELGIGLRHLRHLGAGVNTYERYRTLAVASPSGTPRIVDAREVASLVSCTPGELRSLERQGRRFVRQFFTDLERAMASLAAEPWT